MIESIYSTQIILREIDRSSYGPFVRKLAAEYLQAGYRPKNVQVKFTLILPLIRWSAYEGLSPERLRSQHVSKFFASLDFLGKKPSSKGTLRTCQRLFELIEERYHHRLIVRPIPPYQRNPKVNQEVARFEVYLRDLRGLTPTSILRFKTTIGQFLFFIFPKGAVEHGKLQPKYILDFLEMRGVRFQPRTVRTDGSAIKSYLRYLYGKGQISRDLSLVVPRIACWRNQNVIHTISEESMIKMLMTCRMDHPLGVRDYAVLLLLMRYGLRPIEVSQLTLSDIRWKERKFVIRGKGRKTATLPLEADVAAALRRYICEARPLSREKAVFLSSKAPIVPLAQPTAISAIVRHAIVRAGLKPEIFGARLLRYSVASAILNRGGNLMEVAELLRHSSMNTTVRYTQLDLKRLKLVPLPWPEGK